MNRSVRFRQLAKNDLEEIVVYFGLTSAAASQRFAARVSATLSLLADQPGMGAKWPARRNDLQGIRRFPFSDFRSFLIFYVPRDNFIDVVRIIHGVRDIGKAVRAG
ncbi:MAG: type II toxin-antitoxin system RelE/ParE family toxin [Planctomycetota bacterium]